MDAASLRTILSFAGKIPLVTGGGAHEIPRRDDLRGRTVATLFFEDSTRTRTSFTIAAQRLGADVVDLSGGTTSVNKGETIVDTATNVEAMGIDAIIVRARQSGAAAMAAARVQCPVINAGDGKHEHPTQGLLDTLTIAEAHGRGESFDLSGLRIAIVGDVASSRVARSGIAAMTALGATIMCVGPAGMVSPAHAGLMNPGATGRCEITHDLDAVLPTVDAVMMLRIQFERAGEGGGGGGGGGGSTVAGVPAARKTALIASIRDYRHGYALTRDRAALLKPSAVVMHPGPMNRGLEIDGEVADGPRSVILRQVSNGVRVRMAALALCHAASKAR